MKSHAALSLIALASALALTGPGTALGNPVTDFRLPTPSPTPTGDVQGPVVDGVPPPRPVNTPTPRPTPTATARPAPTPSPTATPTGSATTPAPIRTPAPGASATPRPAASTPARPDSAPVPVDLPASEETASPDAAETGTASPLPLPPATGTPTLGSPTASAQEDEGSGSIWPWLLLIVASPLVLGAIGYGAWRWKQDRARMSPVTAPLIERPEPRPIGATAAASPPAAAAATDILAEEGEDDEDAITADGMRFALEARSLTLSLVTATLSYRITLTNSGPDVLQGIVVNGDMISAHASLPVEQQKASMGNVLSPRHRHPRLAPGESVVFTGEFRIPLNEIRPIRKDQAAYFVPLARWRVHAGHANGTATQPAGGDAATTLVQTSVIGQRAQRTSQGLQPFRIDLGPRVYREVSQRTFA